MQDKQLATVRISYRIDYFSWDKDISHTLIHQFSEIYTTRKNSKAVKSYKLVNALDAYSLD
jgi:hypothetical protein